ncbi:interleukin-17 receptor D [Aplochiton taeniatus]
MQLQDCSLTVPGKHAIHEVSNVSFSHASCDGQAAVVVHWRASPLGIEHVKGFKVYLEDKKPEGMQCQHMVLKDPRQLNFSHKNIKLSSGLFAGLAFDTDYMVRIVPFPTFMNDSLFPPSFLRTNSCEVLLGPDNLVCKPFWRPKTLDVSQLGSSLRVVFDQAPSSFGFHLYYVFYRLRQDGPSRTKRCTPESTALRTTCVLYDVAPGTYAIELRDDTNTTRGQTQYHVSQVHSPWAGPIRAMAITVPLVVLSAFATLFTVMCRKKQQENIYSQLDEDSSESVSPAGGSSSERRGPRPRVFLCYSTNDGPKHLAVVQNFALFLQDFCGCEVILDLWEHLEICKEGQMSWLSRQLDEAHYIITVCSKGLRYYVEKKSRRGKTPVSRRGNGSGSTGSGCGELFIVTVAMIAEKLRAARLNDTDSAPSQALSRFMAVYFDYSTESDIPTMLSLAPRYKLMDQLPQLFGRLHANRQPINVSKRNYFLSGAGRSLYVAICSMHQHIALQPDWFETQLIQRDHPSSSSSSSSSSPSRPGTSTSSSSSPPTLEKFDSGLVLNEVVVKSSSEVEGAVGRNIVLLSSRTEAASSHTLAHCSLPLPGHPASSSCLSLEEPCSSQEVCPPSRPPPRPPLSPGVQGSPTPSEKPRDSGIYDSSVPSSELSIPLMEGLSPDQADSASLAGSESSSSGLGDEEPPAGGPLHCIIPTVCKGQLHHHHHHLELSEGLTAINAEPV